VPEIKIEAQDISFRTSTDGGFKLTLDLGGDLETAKSVAMLGLLRRQLLRVTISTVDAAE
jgi:hypothetical protein